MVLWFVQGMSVVFSSLTAPVGMHMKADDVLKAALRPVIKC